MTRVLSAVAWPYTNGPRHIGHVAGFGVPSDVFSRFMRMAGHDVLMVSGTDEHGTPILVLADNEGLPARELVDKYNQVIVDDLCGLGLSYDLFTRTTTGNHYAVVQEMFETCRRNGYMVEKTTKTAISPSTGRTLPDRYIEGTCPICKYTAARGDDRRSTGRPRSSRTRSTGSSTCRHSPGRWGSGSTSARRPVCGAPTSSSSARTSSRRSGRAR
jgi:methionyl-tRNA synthetase